MYKKTYYELCISPHMPIVFYKPSTGCKAYQYFGAKWHKTSDRLVPIIPSFSHIIPFLHSQYFH